MPGGNFLQLAIGEFYQARFAFRRAIPQSA
jgi:hypothetical protein